MRLPFLKHLLVASSRAEAEDWFYRVGCIVSSVTLASAMVALVSFCLDYFSHSPVFHSLWPNWHLLLYAMFVVLAVVAAVPQLLFGLTAALDINCGERICLAGMMRLARIGNFYSPGSFTRYLFVSTLSTACVIFCNTMSVIALYYGVSSMFEMQWAEAIGHQPEPSIDRLQRHFKCCGLHGYTDWLKVGSRHVPASCRSEALTTDVVRRDNASSMVTVHGRGCLSPLTTEQAIVCGISNMLAFAGVLLLVAVWTQVERAAEVTETELKRSSTFDHPRHFGDAAAFIQQRQMRQASRYTVYSSANQQGLAGLRRSDTSSDTHGSRDSFLSAKVARSEGFLHQHDASDDPESLRRGKASSESDNNDPLASRHNAAAAGGNSSGGCNRKCDSGNSNNSAMEGTGPQWLNARVVNSIDSQVALRLAWEFQEGGGRTDAVQLVDEQQPLDPRRLLDSGISSRRRRHPNLRGGCVTQSQPLLLADFLTDWQRQHGGGRRREPFCTAASGRFPLPVGCPRDLRG